MAILPFPNTLSSRLSTQPPTTWRVLVSGGLANNLKLDWVSLGRQELKGVTNPIEVFGLPST